MTRAAMSSGSTPDGDMADWPPGPRCAAWSAGTVPHELPPGLAPHPPLVRLPNLRDRTGEHRRPRPGLLHPSRLRRDVPPGRQATGGRMTRPRLLDLFCRTGVLESDHDNDHLRALWDPSRDATPDPALLLPGVSQPVGLEGPQAAS